MARNRTALILLAVVSSLFFGCVQPNPQPPQNNATNFQDNVGAIINAPAFAHSAWGIMIKDLNTNETLYSMNGEKMFAPASTTKLYSSAAVLDAYGADYVFKTPVYAKGSIENGTLNGDLILVASGDINMGGRTNASGQAAYTDSDHGDANALGNGILTDTDPLAGLDSLAGQVYSSGIRGISGDVIIDDRLFESGHGPAYPVADYVLSPIAINDNVMDITITPSTEGSPATLSSRPQTARYTIISEAQTVSAGGAASLQAVESEPGKLVVEGTIPAGSPPVLRTFSVQKPSDFARALFIEALKRKGISVSASALSKNNASGLPADYSGMEKVAQLESLPISEEIKIALKTSQNYHADTYPLLLAAKYGQKNFYEGMAMEKPFFQRAGLDLNSISFGDGEGGVRSDMATPAATVRLLAYMHGRSDSEAYKNALPIAGVDGTLAGTLDPGSPIMGKVFAKTGGTADYDAVNGRPFLVTRGLAGYMTTASGRELAFAIYVNNVPISSISDMVEIMKDINRILEQVYLSY